MKQISPNNKIFTSPSFIKDSTKFHVAKKNFDNPNLLLLSDEQTYIICRGQVGLPTWIWTIDNVSLKAFFEIKKALKTYISKDMPCKFTSKKELYNLLIQDQSINVDSSTYFELGTMTCHRLKQPKQCEGLMRKATAKDTDILTQYWHSSSIEMNDTTNISVEEARKDIENMISSERLFIWEVNNKVVSMLYYTVIDNEACLNHAYTAPEEREKGYIANLLYNLTKILIDKNLTSLLYTDYQYPASNKAYKNVGYIDTGILINYTVRGVV